MNTGRSRQKATGVLSRRRLQVATVALGALLVASGVAVVKPRDYRAETLLRVRGPSSMQSDQLAQRVDAIARQVVARATLQNVATRLAEEGVAVDELAEKTDVEATPGATGAWEVTIAHTARDPITAARVVQTLAADYQESAVQRPIDRQAEVVATQESFAADARAELTVRQDELDRYVAANQDYLEGPEDRLRAVREQIDGLERVDIASYEGEISRLAEMMTEEPEFIVEETEVRDERRIAELRKAIRTAEAELTVLQVEQKRTDAHPAVVAKRKILMDLRDELGTVQSHVTTRKVETPNEMYASLVKAKIDTEADLARARRKLTVLRMTESDLLEEVRRAPDLRSERDRLAAALAAAQQTVNEQEAALSEAQAALDALRAERPLEFETLTPPTPPRSPAGPSTLMIAAIGLLLGAAVGTGVAYSADARDHSFRDPTRVAAVLGLPMLGAVDVIRTPAEERRLTAARRRKMHFVIGMGAAACVLLGFAMYGNATPIQELVRTMLP